VGVGAQERKIKLVGFLLVLMALDTIVIDILSTSSAFKPRILYDSFEEVGELTLWPWSWTFTV
jgi:hypothetical protein